VLRWILQGSGEDCGVVSDCEELVGFIQYVCVVVFSYGVLLQLFQKLLD